MPTRVNQLATSLEKIIYAYIGSRPKALTDDLLPDEQSVNLDEYIHVDMSALELDEYIQASAARTTGCDRKPLMSYIAHGVKLLNTLQENPKPLDEEAAISLKQELTQLMVNMQLLLVMPKTEQITVKYQVVNDQTIEVNLIGCCGCYSGTIIQDVLFSAVKLTSRDIGEYINDIVNAHQYPLLIQDNKRLVDENSVLTRDFNSLATTLMNTGREMEEMREQFSKQIRELREELRSQQERPTRSLKPQSPHSRFSLFQTIADLCTDTNSSTDEVNNTITPDFFGV